jgi:membrane-associated phospholipid phosphatase
VRAARVVSYIFHPLLLTTYMVLLMGILMPSMLLVRPQQLVVFTAFIFGITFLLPVFNIFIFRRYGFIDSWNMGTQKERILPSVFISILYILIAGLFVFKVQWSINFTRLMIIVTALVVTATLATFFFKVSFHSLAWWGLIGIIMPLNKIVEGTLLWPTAGLIFLAGIVMASRLKLDAHTPNEVMGGALIGFTVGFGGMALLF